MAQVICSCGAVVSATRTATGWEIKLGSCSIQRNCEEFREARQLKLPGHAGGMPNAMIIASSASRSVQSRMR
jgi:hypothetical protein